MEQPQELYNLESNQPHIVEDAKKKIHQTFNITKEPWLINGLFDYYLHTNSARAIEILVSVREPHDKYLFDKLCESLKTSTAKLQALTVLGHVLRRQPAWLFKITQHQLLKELLKLLKTETDILPLLSALLVVVVLLPMMPALIGQFLPDIFDIFSRLAAWNCNPGRLGEEQLVHLQVAMYALFLRLYGMYPCNFLSYLRNHYRQGDNMPVFIHTVKPMLGTVKIHPHLVTASKDNETETVRWKQMGHHDVIVECEKFALDVNGSGMREDSCYMGLTSSFRSRSGTASTSTEHPSDVQLQQSLKYTTTNSSQVSAATGSAHGADKDFWSPSLFFYSQNSSSPPPALPEVCAPTSIPHTPNSQIPNSQNYVVSSVFPHQEGTSPPEAAIEATPETTPIKDPRLITTGRPLPVVNSSVARALNTNSSKWSNLTTSTGSTPSHSQPSSPMRKEPSPFRFPTEGSAFELSTSSSSPTIRRDTVVTQQLGVTQKLLRVMQERSQVNDTPIQLSAVRGKSTHVPTSPLRVIPRYYEASGSVPNSPVPLVDGPGGAREWPPVARPRPEKNGLPITIGQESSQEDQEIVEIVRQGEIHAGATRSQLCDSVLQSHGDDYEYDTSGDCCGESQELQHQGSPCTSGGLHMPNSHSLQAFATRVHRLRYYSQCGPVHDTSETSAGSSPGQNIPVLTNARVRRANSCPEMKKNYSGSHAPESLGKALDESDELNIDATTITSTPGQENSGSSKLNGVNERRLTQRSISTQTLDLWPMPYEHLFLGIFPLLESNTEIRPSPAPSPAPFALADKSVRFSPYEMLDKYIEQACHGNEHDGKRSKVHSLESEIKNLREQLGLVHLQLQYERHRREVHAVRNRRLLGESRNNKVLEEHNSALRDQVSLLQKEIEHLNAELNTKKQEFNYREKELQEVVSYWHEQCLLSQEDNKSIRSVNESLQRDLTAQIKRTDEVSAQHQHAEADLFRLGSEMGVALERASQGERLRAELEHVQRELLLAGELNQKFRERLAQWPLIEHRHEESKLLADSYHDEIRTLTQQLDGKNAIIESQKAHLQELEHAVQQRDDLCASQKRILKDVVEEYNEQLLASESKYDAQKNINKSLEERILDLWQRIEISSRARPVHSPDTSSCHEAGVDRAMSASAQGGLSPHSSPLSASLASSEGSMAFLQQQGQGDVREIKNLQVIVDQSESGTQQQPPKPSPGSEDTTPDGNNPLFYNQSD